MRKKIFLFIFLLISPCLFFAINVHASYDYMGRGSEKVYNTQNGLLSTETNDVCQTSDGYIWLAQY